MELKEVSYGDVKLLWHVDWYDGELAGFLIYEGVFCHFNITDQYDPKVDKGWYRKYSIYPLTVSEMMYEKNKQEWRKECVGNDNEYGEEKIFYLKDASWEKFSEKYPEKDDRTYDDRPVVAILKM